MQTKTNHQGNQATIDDKDNLDTTFRESPLGLPIRFSDFSILRFNSALQVMVRPGLQAVIYHIKPGLIYRVPHIR